MPRIGIERVTSGLVQLDDTDKLAVSLYGKGSAEGDTVLDTSGLAGGNCLEVDVLGIGGVQISAPPQGDNKAVSYTQAVIALGYRYNGSTFDRMRNNALELIAASAARTAVLTGADMVNFNARGLLVVVNVTARAAASTLQVEMQLKDPISGEYKQIWTAAGAINTADDTITFLFYPTVAGGADLYTETVDMVLPKYLRFVVTPNDANSVTYSVSAAWLL